MSDNRVYKYAARPPAGEDLKLILDQYHKAHVYRNKLVEIELARRAAVDKALVELSPRLVEVEAEIGSKASEADAESGAPAKPATGLVADLEREQDLALRERAQVRGRPVASNAGAIKALKAKLKELYAERKALRTALFESEAWKATQDRINQENHDALIAARTAASADGLRHGSYSAVEEAAESFRKGAPPEFRPWRKRKDRCGVQLQGGCKVEDLLAGKDTRVQLQLVDREPRKCDGCRAKARRERKVRPCTCDKLPPISARRAAHAVLLLRVGSSGKGNRVPIWARIPMVYHRPLPAEARIQRVYLLRRDLGARSVWSVTFTLRHAWDRSDRATEGTVGVDVGWRKLDDGSLRVAAWCGSDGARGEVRLPAWWLAQSDRVNRIRGYRDTNLDAIKFSLGEWLKTQDDLPEFLAEVKTSLHAWRSAERLQKLFRQWRVERVNGDKEAIEKLEQWSKRDRHLQDFEVNLRDQLQGSRRDLYRRWAAQMSRRYSKAVIEDLDLRKFHRLPPVEDGMTRQQDVPRVYVREACLSDLLTPLKDRMSNLVKVDAENTTKTCPACGEVDKEWHDRMPLLRKCPSCAVERDQDHGAAVNILRAGGETVDYNQVLALIEVETYAAGPNKRRKATLERWADTQSETPTL